ncbi:ABC transporter substrate-binding protein [Paenibacillus sacheonensis]|uniref:Extracellular solute-binding protein n=1 Tax=Paenibacillus sacheonensis TaxID=742054 RepID=A0A7X4YR56_9BACL|nr:sugar ABC transporter substrate-binding protein [Paenibacillus sacheonensis]MBM7565131.1 ABC-type glycerol-3-phosphate transport system substrate-binding protein [Paenibacillus sacheonensis]NBC70086.1 extracellular solute-binding protein [Paenibacillus sacheonensis]
MKAIKIGTTLTAFLLVAGMLSACGNSGNDNTGNTGNTQNAGNAKNEGNAGNKGDAGTEKAEVTLMTWESQDMNNKIMESMKKFEQENPGITVKLMPAPLSDYGTKLNGMITAKQAPDIFQLGNDMLVSYQAQNLLYDWTEHASADADFMNGFYPGVMDGWKVDGKNFGLPGLLNTYGIFYNKQLFKDAGLTEPKIGWTYDEFFADMKKLSSKKDGVQQYGFYFHPDPFTVSLYAASAGGAPFADSLLNPTSATVSPQFVEGVTRYQQAIAEGSMNPATFDLSTIMGPFKDGKVAMTYQGQWIADDLIRNAPDLQWGFVPMPVVTTQTEIYDAVGWATPVSTKNPDAVWKVLKYLDSTMYKDVLPQTPVAPSAFQASASSYYDTLKAAGHQDLADGIDHILKSPTTQPVRFLTAWAGKANPFIDTVWNNVLSGKGGEKELQSMADKINKTIKAS